MHTSLALESIPDTVRMDAALARLLNLSLQALGQGEDTHQAAQQVAQERSWGWIEAAQSVVGVGVEITEHLLPDGVDFLGFQQMLAHLQ